VTLHCIKKNIIYFLYKEVQLRRAYIVNCVSHVSTSPRSSSSPAQFDSAGHPLLDREEPCRHHHTLTRQPQHPPAPLPLQHHGKHKSWSQKILRSSPTLSTPSPAPPPSPGSPDTESCPVDPALPLEKQRWVVLCFVSGRRADSFIGGAHWWRVGDAQNQ